MRLDVQIPFWHAGVGESDWIFRASFEMTAIHLADSNADLVFEGLDTFAVVQLVRVFAQHIEIILLILSQNGYNVLEYANKFQLRPLSSSAYL